MKYDVVILGAGESGIGAALLAKKKEQSVFVSEYGLIADSYRQQLEEAAIPYEQSGHSMPIVLQAQLIIKSPGIPEKAPVMLAIREANIPVISEIEYAARYTQGQLIAITGSNGKTTTTSLIYHILKAGGLDAALVGNIGDSFAGELAKRDHDVFVIEVSSFQLDDTVQFHPNIAVLTNLSPDHLDRYHYNYQEYIDSKFKIVQNQDAHDAFIVSGDDADTQRMMAHRPPRAQVYQFSTEHPVPQGAYQDKDQVFFNVRENQFTMSIYEFALKGKHNTSNSMAAGIVGELMGIRKDVIRQSLQDFRNLEHRMEPVSVVRGVDFINDSKATNVNSTWYALESMNKPVVWIAGGVDKGNDYESLKSLAKSKVKALVCLGTDNAKLKESFGDVIPEVQEAQSMADAVRMAYYLAEKGDVVLLSPACASFDLFNNYEDRGNQFKQAVRDL